MASKYEKQAESYEEAAQSIELQRHRKRKKRSRSKSKRREVKHHVRFLGISQKMTKIFFKTDATNATFYPVYQQIMSQLGMSL